MMASIAELYERAKRKWPEQDFGPDDSMIASAIRDPSGAASRLWGAFVGGVPTMQDDPYTQLYKSTGTLAGMINPVGRQMPGTLAAIKASHGTPHAFTKFDMGKVGEGAGAQSYGHGLYFAKGFDSPVAKEYQEDAENWGVIDSINARIAELAKIMHSDSSSEYGKFRSDIGRNAKKEYDLLMDQRDKAAQNPGYLYNVDLKWLDPAREAADPLGEHHLLDWDAPLSQQPEKIRGLLAAFGDGDPAGAHIYNQFMNLAENTGEPGQVAASRKLRELGIPGIRYSQGNNSNFVIFDDRIPNIVNRNGRSLADLVGK
jgi:hypothetical protein